MCHSLPFSRSLKFPCYDVLNLVNVGRTGLLRDSRGSAAARTTLLVTSGFKEIFDRGGESH